MFTLFKLSAPGWEKDFNTEQEVTNELAKYICRYCIVEDHLMDTYSLGDLLATACGCEFDVEDHMNKK